ncbi:MAG: hypothetical protein ACLFRK_00985 [Candidatus Nanohaloarchaea archaeon]
MIAGLNLTTGKSFLAKLGDGLEIIEVETNEDIAEELEDVEVLAVNASFKPVEGLSDDEEDLVEEGYSFSPSTNETDLNRRAVHLKQLLFEKGLEVELIRFDEMITSRELAIGGDQALESYGIDTSEITCSEEFDAVLGAVTARFYQQDQCRDLGVQIPEALNQKT